MSSLALGLFRTDTGRAGMYPLAPGTVSVFRESSKLVAGGTNAHTPLNEVLSLLLPWRKKCEW